MDHHQPDWDGVHDLLQHVVTAAAVVGVINTLSHAVLALILIRGAGRPDTTGAALWKTMVPAVPYERVSGTKYAVTVAGAEIFIATVTIAMYFMSDNPYERFAWSNIFGCQLCTVVGGQLFDWAFFSAGEHSNPLFVIVLFGLLNGGAIYVDSPSRDKVWETAMLAVTMPAMGFLLNYTIVYLLRRSRAGKFEVVVDYDDLVGAVDPPGDPPAKAKDD